MGMHPKTEASLQQRMYDLLFDEDKLKNLEEFIAAGLIEEKNINNWINFLNKNYSESKTWQNTIDYFKRRTDALVETNSFLSSKQPLEIVNNFITSSEYFGFNCKNIDSIRNKTILDFGSGVYRTLSASIILYCNGFDRVFSFEPFPIKFDYVQRSFYQLIEIISNNPSKFKFSNISDEEFISRLKSFIYFNTNEKIEKFYNEENYILKISGLTLFKNIDQIPSNSIDIHFSNAVLEHVVDVKADMKNLYRITKDDSIGFHIVDFLDHRYYDDDKLSPMEKYFDGINDEINGLTPSEIEFQIATASWKIKKIQSKLIPDTVLSSDRRNIIDRYKSFPIAELREHLNIYYFYK